MKYIPHTFGRKNTSPPIGPEWARAIPDKSPAVIVDTTSSGAKIRRYGFVGNFGSVDKAISHNIHAIPNITNHMSF